MINVNYLSFINNFHQIRVLYPKHYALTTMITCQSCWRGVNKLRSQFQSVIILM